MGGSQAKPPADSIPMSLDGSHAYRPPSSISTDRSVVRSGLWEPMDPQAHIERFEDHLWRHAILNWVFLPIFVLAQEFIPAMKPTCDEGFRDATLIVILLAELHHICTERSAWQAAKSLISPPEISVLRQLGFLRQRARLVVFGVLEGVDLYTDLCFPFIARACIVSNLTIKWQVSWQKVPLIGHNVVWLLDHYRFWGIAALFTIINVVITGWYGLVELRSHTSYRREQLRALEERRGEGCPRIGGQIWFGWAMSSSTAMMPSLVHLCEAMADQKKYSYKGDVSYREKNSVSYRGATQARVDAMLGRLSGDAEMYELRDYVEQERVEAAGKSHYVRLLLVKVFIGNVMSLWLQSSYLALQFETCGPKARAKIIFSMAISAIQALVRCSSLTARAGCLGYCLTTVIMFFLAWTGGKVYFAFKCADHVWGFTTGCVEMPFELGGTLGGRLVGGNASTYNLTAVG